MMNNSYTKLISAITIFLIVISTIGFSVYISTAHAAINKQINYQGKLANSSDVAVANGTYTIEFKLYTQASGGSAIWTETLTGADKVQVTSGLFSVMLGAVTSLASVDFNQTLYLGVNIENDGEMTPRKIIGAVPSAFVADSANTLSGLTSSQFLRSDTGSATSGYFIATSSTASILPYASTTALSATTICLTTDCRTSWPASGGSGGGSWSTTTSQVSGQFINHSNNNSDIVAIGNTSTTTARFWFDPNTQRSYLTYASTTALTVSGTASTTNLVVSNSATLNTVTANALTLGSLTGLLYGTNGSVGTIATSSLGLVQLSDLTSYLSLANWFATTTNGLTEGTINKYYSDSLVNSYISASTTIPKTYTANTFTGAQTFTNAPTFSSLTSGGLAVDASGNVYKGATSTLSTISGTLNLGTQTTGTLAVLNGGTGQTSFGQGWLGINDSGAFISSTSPTVAYITATSTTATSTFAAGIQATYLNLTGTSASSTASNGINLSAGCFAVNNTCLTNSTYGDSSVNSYINASTTIPKTYTANVFTGAQTFNGSNIFGGAATFNSMLTVGSLNGPLQAINGVISASSTLAAVFGGTGWSSILSGALIYGNGSSALATTTAGTAGYVLSYLNGIPTWTATTTFGTGLTYTSGNVTVNTSQNIATLSNLTGNGFVKTSGGTGALSIDTNTYLTSALTSIGPTGQTTTGPAVTLATSSTAFNGLTASTTITGSGATLTFANTLSGKLSEAGGGTNQSTYTTGDMLYSSNTNTLSKLGIGTAGYVLGVSNGLPAWVATTTFSSGLTYLNGNVTNTGLLSLQQLGGGTAQTGAITFGTSSQTTNGQTVGLNITNSTGAFTFTPTVSGTLTVAGGGTGQTSFGQGWLGINDSGAFVSSTSPTVNYITATSTTATSTFAGDFVIGGVVNSAAKLNIIAGSQSLTFGQETGNTSILSQIGTTFSEYRNQVGTMDMRMGAYASKGYLGTNSSHTLSLFTSNIDRLTILPGGNIGIGTSTPYSPLSVWGGSTGRIAEFITSASSTALSISATGFGTTTLSGLNISGSATTTSNVGVNLSAGCFAVNNVCVVGSSSYGDSNVNSYISASTTIPKTYTANTFTGAQTFTNAPTFSSLTSGGLAVDASGNVYKGATSTLSTISGTLNLGTQTTGTLAVLNGGTGQTSFGQGWLGINDSGAFVSSTSPTVAYITATSTTATSTFAYDVSVTGALKVAQSGNNAVSVGYNNSASDVNAVALGSGNTASGSGSIAIGMGNIGSASSISVAIGKSNTASGLSSSAFGYGNSSLDTQSSAFGYSNTASGNGSSAFGYLNIASAINASVFGSSITNSITDSTMIGPSDFAKLTILSTGETQASYFRATSTTASIFPYASTTALTVSGINGLTLGSITGPLQAINGVVSASSTLSVAYGGTGQTSFGQGWLGINDSGAFISSTSPTVAYITATSTTVTSTFAGGATFATGGGNVGIGTTTPKAKLHVLSSTGGNSEVARFTSQYSVLGSGPFIRFTNVFDTSTNPSIGEYNLAGITAYDYDNNWGGALGFMTPNTGVNGGGDLIERMTIAPGGNVGIGTTTPGTILSLGNTGVNTINISATATSTFGFGINLRAGCFAINSSCLSHSNLGGTVAVTNGGTGQTSFGQGWLGINDSGAFISSTSPTVNYITATSTTATSTFAGGATFATGGGNVGIGTSSPYAKLSVTNTGTGPSFVVEDSTSPDTTPFIIDASGNVGIGTSTIAANTKLHIDTGSASVVGLVVQGATSQSAKLTTWKDVAGTTLGSMSRGGALHLGSGAGGGYTYATDASPQVDISYGGVPTALMIGAESNLSTRTNNTGKVGRIGLAPYSSNALAVMIFGGSSNSSTNLLTFGGGTSVLQAATQVDFYTSSATNTPTGTSRLTIDSLGNVGINDTTPTSILDISLSTSNTAKTSAFNGIDVNNTATSSTASIVKAGIDISSTGTWSGSNASNIGLYVSSVTGGTNNYDAIFNGGGNVGVGTTSPYAKLSIQKGYGNTNTTLFSIASSTSSTGSTANTLFDISNTGVFTSSTTVSSAATSTINGNLYVNGTLRSTLSYVGDLFFANNFSFAEAPLDGETQGLLLRNQRGQDALTIDENGNMSLIGDVCYKGKQCFGKSINDLESNMNALASTTSNSLFSAQATTTASLSELTASLGNVNQAIINLGTRIDTLSSTTVQALDTRLSELTASTTFLNIVASSTANLLASSTADTLASSTPSFITRVAVAVQEYIQSTGEWFVNKLTAHIVYTDRLETQTLCIGKTCISEDELKALLMLSPTAPVIAPIITPTVSTGTTTPISASTSTLPTIVTPSATSTSSVEVAPTPTPTSTPTPISTPVPIPTPAVTQIPATTPVVETPPVTTEPTSAPAPVSPAPTTTTPAPAPEVAPAPTPVPDPVPTP